MRYVPRKPREGINVSDEHPLVEAGTLIVGLGLIFALIALALIFMVEVVLYFVPAETEVELFSAWTPDDLQSVDDKDPRRDSTQALVDRLAVHWSDSPYQFRVEINDDELSNAMAFPGGLIVVTSGLLEQAESENELAFILGHELGHFRNRDHIRALGRGVVMGILFAAISGNDGGANLGTSIADLTLRSFNRGQETSADEFGLEVVFKEYGHVAGAWHFFERVKDDDRESSEFITYVSTHPSPIDRIEKILERAAANGWSITGPLTENAW